MNDRDQLAEQFEAHRGHLLRVAHRMLGSLNEAEDAVQETWLRLSRSDTSEVANLGGWLTTVVGRVCLDVLRSRKARREEPLGTHGPEPVGGRAPGSDPEEEALLADSIGLALLVVLDTLAPAERIAFVLHDTFAVPFDEIAPIVGRSPNATKMLASRARRRVRGAATTPDTDRDRHRVVVDAFLAAARAGDFTALLALLDPDVVLRSDAAAEQTGSPKELSGGPSVADMFSGRARAAQPALVNGAVGAVWAPGGRPRVVFDFTITDGKIVAIDILADPDRLRQLEVTMLA